MAAREHYAFCYMVETTEDTAFLGFECIEKKELDRVRQVAKGPLHSFLDVVDDIRSSVVLLRTSWRSGTPVRIEGLEEPVAEEVAVEELNVVTNNSEEVVEETVEPVNESN